MLGCGAITAVLPLIIAIAAASSGRVARTAGLRPVCHWLGSTELAEVCQCSLVEPSLEYAARLISATSTAVHFADVSQGTCH
jgi:hypothetical protein